MIDDLWLERWLVELNFPSEREVLELGCGSGRDTKYLADRGFQVVAVDVAEDALETCARHVPTARPLRHDIAQPLPFTDESYPVIIASLSLHYFSRQQTLSILNLDC